MSFSDGKSILSSNGKSRKEAGRGGRKGRKRYEPGRGPEPNRGAALLITYHSKKYYDEDAPELEDDEFDALTRN